MGSTTNTAAVRLARDYQELIKEPLPNVRAAPSTDNILLWYYIFVGAKDTPFEGGYYHGSIRFDKEYPFKPPHYKILSENGIFQPGQEICISNSAYHAESWNPLWSMSGILNGFLGFFHDEKQVNFIGSVRSQTKKDYIKYAKASKDLILNCMQISELFPDVIEQIRQELNGAEPKHSLPFPPEHHQYKKKATEEAKDQAAEQKRQQTDFSLVFDSSEGSEEDDDP